MVASVVNSLTVTELSEAQVAIPSRLIPNLSDCPQKLSLWSCTDYLNGLLNRVKMGIFLYRETKLPGPGRYPADPGQAMGRDRATGSGRVRSLAR
jgi:hypothetical protein